MNRGSLMFWMAALGTACWPICFLWMHRISKRQNALLERIQDQGKRIEELSQAEHDLIKEVHPQVSEIKEQLDEVAENVTEPHPAHLR
jgi:hypothetical protein